MNQEAMWSAITVMTIVLSILAYQIVATLYPPADVCHAAKVQDQLKQDKLQ